MLGRVLAVLGVAVVLGAVGGTDRGEAAFPGANGKIAFSSNRDGTFNLEIYTIEPDGSEPTRLTTQSGSDAAPAWSADGTKLAFESSRDGNVEVYTMNANGSAQTNVTQHTATDGLPVWSPDGTRLAFHTSRDFNFEIYSIGADGTNPVRLTNNPASEFGPAWSPNGTRIAFVTLRHGAHEIYAINNDGTNETRLTDNPAADDVPSWSPDGARIAFASNRDGNNEIYVMNADGTGQTRLTTNAADDFQPAWSPDGTKIVFESTRDGNRELYVMNADGTSVVRLTNHGATDERPDWQPFAAASPLPTLTISDASVVEGDSGTTTASFTVTRSSGSGSASVDFATADGTATASSDYTATSGTLNFDDGDTTKTISVPVIGDTVEESDETFFVDLSDPSGATIEDGQGQGTITNDDAAAPPSTTPSLSIGDVEIPERDEGDYHAVFTVSLSSASVLPVTVDFSSADGTATAPADYDASSGTLTFAPGETSKTITVLVHGDTLEEATETFNVNLANAAGATIADGQGQGTIVDNDSPEAADLVMTMSGTPDPADVYGELVYTIDVSNIGDATAANVSVRNEVPAGTQVVTARWTGGVCGLGPSPLSRTSTAEFESVWTVWFSPQGPVNCAVGDLGPGQTRRIEVHVRPLEPGTIVNTASASTSSPEADRGNNAATVETRAARYSAVLGSSPFIPAVSSGPTLYYSAVAGQANDLEITQTASGIHVVDRVSEIRGYLGCRTLSRNEALCPVASLRSVVVETGDGDDRIAVNGIARTDVGSPFFLRASGGPGADAISATQEVDELLGKEGDDTMQAGAGNDRVEGGLGNDVLAGSGGEDELLGSNGDDTMQAGAGNDRVEGGWGNDVLAGSGGDDALVGSRGSDRLVGGGGFDTVSYALRERPVFVDNDAVADDGERNERDNVWTDVEHIVGSPQSDGISGRGGAEVIEGLAGNDELAGGDGPDRLIGGLGDDELAGGPGNDHVEGTSGSDLVLGGRGNDTLLADSEEPGDPIRMTDRVDGGPGNDVIMGGGTDHPTTYVEHRNVLRGGDGNDQLTASVGTYSSFDHLFGDDGSDTLIGTLGSVIDARGGSGSDLIRMHRAHRGEFDGDGGRDTLADLPRCGEYVGDGETVPVPTEVDLGGGYSRCTSSEGNVFVESELRSIENVRGGPGQEILRGSTAENVLEGGGGNDQIAGGRGDDRLFGGMGEDTLSGGRGSDELFLGGDADAAFGGDGDDLIDARDGVRDEIVCEGGRDRAFRDSLDVLTGCEVVSARSLPAWSGALLGVASILDFVLDRDGSRRPEIESAAIRLSAEATRGGAWRPRLGSTASAESGGTSTGRT